MNTPVLYRGIYDNKTISRFGFSRSSRFYHFRSVNPKEFSSQVQIPQKHSCPGRTGYDTSALNYRISTVTKCVRFKP